MSPLRKRRPDGFTLIEAMIVVAIIGVITSLAGAALVYGMDRARLKNALFEVSAVATAAQIRSSSSGVPNYMVFYESGSDFGVLIIQKDDPEPIVSEWEALDVDALPAGWRQVDRLVLSQSERLVFAALSDFTVATVKPPFPTPSLTATGASGLRSACNFCVAAPGGALGALRFSSDGTMRPSPANAALTSALVGLRVSGDSTTPNSKLFAFAIPAGLVRIFDK